MSFCTVRPKRRFLLCVFVPACCGVLLASPRLAGAQQMAASAGNAPDLRYSSETSRSSLPEAPSALVPPGTMMVATDAVSSSSFPLGANVDWVGGVQNPTDPSRQKGNGAEIDVDANGKAIPVDRHQPHRIGGIIPNYRAVSGGAIAHAPGWKYNFKVATHQAFDYSGFVFLGITSMSAEGLNEHKAFGKGVGGFWTYTWHGFIDKTDGTYLQAFLLPSLLHEDTRYYALGDQHRVSTRILYVISRQAVARTYSGHNTPNIAGLGGKVLTQYISRFYYPANTADFGTLAQKFGYSVARDIGFTALREFYPDYVGYQARKRQRRAASQSAMAAAASHASGQSQGTPAASKP